MSKIYLNDEHWVLIFDKIVQYIFNENFNNTITITGSSNKINFNDLHYEIDLIRKNQYKLLDNLIEWIKFNYPTSFEQKKHILDYNKRNLQFFKRNNIYNNTIDHNTNVNCLSFSNSAVGSLVNLTNRAYYWSDGYIINFVKNSQEVNLKKPLRRIGFKNAIRYTIDSNYDIITAFYPNYIKILMLNNDLMNQKWIKINNEDISNTFNNETDGLENSSTIIEFNSKFYLLFNKKNILYIYEFFPEKKLIKEVILDKDDPYMIMNIKLCDIYVFITVQYRDYSPGLARIFIENLITRRSDPCIYLEKYIIIGDGFDAQNYTTRPQYESGKLLVKYMPNINYIYKNYEIDDYCYDYLIYSGGQIYKNNLTGDGIIGCKKVKHITHTLSDRCIRMFNKINNDLFVESDYYTLRFINYNNPNSWSIDRRKIHSIKEYNIPLVYLIEPIYKRDIITNEIIINKLCLVLGLGCGFDKLHGLRFSPETREMEQDPYGLAFDKKNIIDPTKCNDSILLIIEFNKTGSCIKILENILFQGEIIKKVKHNPFNKQLTLISNKRFMIYDVY